MIFALDFDRTLFDTDHVLSLIRQQGLESQIGDPQVHLSIDPAPFLYGDVIPFLTARQSADKVFIVSAVTARYGSLSEAYQRDKIMRTGVGHLVHEVVLTGDSKVAALQKISTDFPTDEIIFVDDMVDHLIDIQHAVPRVHCIHMERSGAKRNSTMDIPHSMKAVHTLTELLQALSHIAV